MNRWIALLITASLMLIWNLATWFLVPDWFRKGKGLDTYCLIWAFIGAIVGGFTLL